MTRGLKLTIVAALLFGALAGCERARNVFGPAAFEYQGTSFKGKVTRDRDDRANFSVTVRGADRGLPGALEAARVAANRYCIKEYGNTDITWSGATPDDEPESVVLDASANLTMSGRCDTW